jgi:hypothetical protein
MATNTQIDSGKCIKVIDPETKKIIGIFDSKRKLKQSLGINFYQIDKSCSERIRCYSETLNKKVACRLISKTPEMNFSCNGMLLPSDIVKYEKTINEK